ncbi:hypothetical protein [Oceanobacter sp. 3_MG-2023]|uniref:hypothetical protein n=1 Tax=Oceanobacter sp. 3_MG-2023 TaxID=3062622 RepID=UPI00273507F3|nr:hypothetical protein [Oceanobacter sp. 3_MG-2023]MDP2505399.1 hypothetical protein [Oceanobacter sp. 3_MG-2023]
MEDVYKQALEALAAEAVAAGVNIKELTDLAAVRVIGNEKYAWLSTGEKSKLCDVLHETAKLFDQVD